MGLTLTPNGGVADMVGPRVVNIYLLGWFCGENAAMSADINMFWNCYREWSKSKEHPGI